MKTIGLIGGMSWKSTIPYYSIINEYINEKLGGFHSARIILYSVEFDEIEKCQSGGDWEKSAEILGETSVTVGLAGQAVVLSIMDAKVILAKIQRYADACYMVTQGHRKAIEALTTVEDVESYDYTQGYPEKLTISE